MQELGLARPTGRPPNRSKGSVHEAAEDETSVEALALAGAQLLQAVDEHLGAVHALTEAMGARLLQLPQPAGDVLDDTANRYERGRFTSSYNAPRPRMEPELGDKFNSVTERRATKDLPAMRVVANSFETRHRKNLSLVMLPCVVRGGRWSELQYWRGDQLGELVGFAYQASTLDKHLREVKLAGCAESSRAAVASSWLNNEGPVIDQATGAEVLYADTSLKPLRTHHWTRSAKVSKTGRIQPEISTISLHSGVGTPLLFRTFSGGVSLPDEVETFLCEHECHAGEGAVRRIIIMDREAHTIALFKRPDPKWSFIIPLRSHVTGPNAQFSEQEPWSAYGEGPDEVCNAKLLLRDRRKGEDDLLIRVVGRRRHRIGKVVWYATKWPPSEFSANDVVRLYFDRWPAQELVYRDANGAVGLGNHHGYGEHKIDNIAVIDRMEKLDGAIRGLEAEVTAQTSLAATLVVERDKH